MNLCSLCGHNLEPPDRYCASCGAPVESTAGHPLLNDLVDSPSRPARVDRDPLQIQQRLNTVMLSGASPGISAATLSRIDAELKAAVRPRPSSADRASSNVDR